MCHSQYNEVDVHIKKNIQENVHISGDNRPVTSTCCPIFLICSSIIIESLISFYRHYFVSLDICVYVPNTTRIHPIE